MTRPTPRLRLRHKLAISLSIAAILPVLAASWVALSVVLGNLEQALRDETEQQLQVGLSMVLRAVERIGVDAARLAGSGELDAAMRQGASSWQRTQLVQPVLDRMSRHLSSSLVQVFDARGDQAAATVTDDIRPRAIRLRIDPDHRVVTGALEHHSPMTMDADHGALVVRAAAPIVDASYRLSGVVVVSVPLDGAFVDRIKSSLGTDVLLYAGVGADVASALSTFIDASGARRQDIVLGDQAAWQLAAGETLISSERLSDRVYSVGTTRLINLDGQGVGVLGVAVDRAPILTAKRVAARSLVAGAAGAFVIALALAALLSRRLTWPLARLHRGAQAVARGDLDYELAVSDGDEIGDLAIAFSHMTRALKENQERLAARVVENARLYEEVRALNEELEGKVKSRTAELTHMNAELGRALQELRETQAQLILSERMAGLGLLVASVAHEINSPSAAIAGSVGALADNIARLTESSHRIVSLGLGKHDQQAYLDFVAETSATLAALPMVPAAAARRASRELRRRLESAGIAAEEAQRSARRLAELGADDRVIARLLDLIAHADPAIVSARAVALVSYLIENVYLHRNTLTIRKAIQRIQRIVGALKTYSHLDQQASFVNADVHEGIENTLMILDYVLGDISIVRDYGPLPQVPVYVDELNQVWTNLLQNALQALEGKGRITISTRVEAGGVAVRVIDDGPGIPAETIPRIFEPFFTTKPKGQGTGLGLGIVRQIVAKHHGTVTCESEPGRTCFCVWLPATQADELRGVPPRIASDRADGDADGAGTEVKT